MNIRNLFVYICLCLVSLCSCGGGGRHDAEFRRIDSMCDTEPAHAIRALDSIDCLTLSERDRHRFDLLTIKSRDKAYIVHTSDSLILDVIDYYEKHRSEGHHAEALYYGGRVYSDIGDLPTALEFFQKSLDEIPDDEDNLRFRRNVLDQTGRALHSLRLDSAAIHYLEQSLLTDIPDDYYGKAFTHGLLAGAYNNQRDFKNARVHINEALNLSAFLNDTEQQDIRTEFADMLLYEGKIDSALMVIRPIPANVDSLSRPYCLAVAAEIYKDAGILDTAYMYARQLTRLATPYNKKTGYKVIFSDEMKGFVPKDTLLKLIPEYKQTIEDFLDTHEAEQAITQNSRYNYSKHVKERIQIEKELHRYQIMMWIAAVVVTSLLFIILTLIFYRKYKTARKETKLLEIFNLTERLKEETEAKQSEKDSNPEVEDVGKYIDIKHRILEKMRILKSKQPESLVDNVILESDTYSELKERIRTGKCITDSEDVWKRIEDLIESVSPGFGKRLDILTEERISPTERKVALLMKCGFTTSGISTLLSRGMNTVSSQKRSLANKISEEKMPLEIVTALIISL